MCYHCFIINGRFLYIVYSYYIIYLRQAWHWDTSESKHDECMFDSHSGNKRRQSAALSSVIKLAMSRKLHKMWEIQCLYTRYLYICLLHARNSVTLFLGFRNSKWKWTNRITLLLVCLSFKNDRVNATNNFFQESRWKIQKSRYLLKHSKNLTSK